MAEGYIYYNKKIAKYIALGIALIIMSMIPYFIFNDNPALYTVLIIIMITMGIGLFVAVSFMEEDKYKVITTEPLIFDQQFYKDIKFKYSKLKNKYAISSVVGVCSIIGGGLPFLLGHKGFVDPKIISSYYPLCIFIIAIGVYILIRCISMIDPYNIIVNNEKYVNSLEFRIMNRVRRKIEKV